MDADRTVDGAGGAILLDVERLDAHPGDLYGRWLTVEVAADRMLSDLLTGVLEPFFASAPRAVWVCRGRPRGRFVDFAEVVTSGPPEGRGARLLVDDETLGSFVGGEGSPFRVGCRPRRS